MTPQEKAQELIDKFSQVDTPNWDPTSGTIEQEQIGFYSGKECALIAVDEIIKQFVGVYDSLKDAGVLDSASVQDSANYKYWQEVKQEIEKL